MCCICLARCFACRTVLADITRAVQLRRLELVPLFKDFDRRNEGYVTKEQFQRVLRVESLMPPAVPAVNALVKKFAGGAERTSLVDYRSFIELVDPRAGKTWLMVRVLAPRCAGCG